MSTLDEYCVQELHALHASNRRRTLVPSARSDVWVTQGDTRYLSFSCNDYLGLGQHPEVVEASNSALSLYGAGAAASRLVTGNHPLYAALEQQLACTKQTEAALVFGSGYLTNVGVIPALVGRGDIIFADKLVHACLLDGAQLSGATVKRFAHNDMAHLEALLTEHRPEHARALLLVDHVYSMDGDVAPLSALSVLAKAHDTWLMVDDAHGLGIVPRDNSASVDVWMGTLSKSLGGYGGYVAASKSVIDLLISKARSFVFSTGLPPASCASALAALTLMAREPERGARVVMLANRVCTALKLPPTLSAIVPIILGSEARALAVSGALKQRGILAVAIRPPTVPPATSRLRLAFSTAHTQAHIEMLIEALRAEGVATNG